MEMNKLIAAIEAILFTMGNSVDIQTLARTLEVSEEEIRNAVQEMSVRYEQEDRGIRILQLEDACQLCTKKEFYEYLIRIAMHPKKPVLTDVMLETLSIVAYKQPVTRLEIEKIRGVKSDHAVNKLVEYDLIKELGRLDAPGRPILFGTTEEFLRCFGVQSMSELPPDPDPVKMADFKAEAEEEIKLKLDI
ncbi:MAG: SMC-Scp complex subunit ScpB [Blautia sp.]|nr:SMC-Scp complex subunit ScpB [Blautia sp.]